MVERTVVAGTWGEVISLIKNANKRKINPGGKFMRLIREISARAPRKKGDPFCALLDPKSERKFGQLKKLA